ncbi:MAG: replication-associated recombination protein A [Bacilli bacterium]|nr:replication-associated recombination protein A [Bacilli bacterium]
MEPLALKLRPNSLKDCLGQKHLIDDGKILSNLVKNCKLFSMILYGKPGIGKTTIATSLVHDLNVRYRILNATINDKHDFEIVFEEAKTYGEIVLILDEIHRLNKDKQDLLLPRIESGLVTLIGLTSSNPFHSINPAIRSRCHLFELKPLEKSDIKDGLLKASKNKELLPQITISDEAIDYIAESSGNDLRYAYNFLELAYYSKEDHKIDLDFLKTIDNKRSFFHDKNDDGYYDVLSAFQKSIRGSDVNASLHYLGRMLEANDLESIFRRMSVICYEDIGLANPSMGPKVEAAIKAAERLGMPEARIPLASVVIELALSPKSNSGVMAIDAALLDIKTGRCGEVPNHIKTTSPDYKYPHDYPHHFVNQQYLPDNLKNKKYYIPCTTSNYEKNLKQTNDNLEKLKSNS